MLEVMLLVLNIRFTYDKKEENYSIFIVLAFRNHMINICFIMGLQKI